jgi:3-phosphoshikimate 1-carboxyvinyltransferase
MKEIKPLAGKIDRTVTVPGSKSFTHRFLTAAALSNGPCTLKNGLKSDDTRYTMSAFQHMGVTIQETPDGFQVNGTQGKLGACAAPIDLGNSGTSMRFLTAMATLGTGTYTLTGTERMQERPLQDLLNGLSQAGAKVDTQRKNGCPPVEITGNTISGGRIILNCQVSSQYLSAVLMASPYWPEGVEVTITQGPVSRPYIDMTLAVMEQFGITVEREGYERFKVLPGQFYRHGTYHIEPDCSQAGYFWAAAAINGGTVKVAHTHKNSVQGDVGLVGLLEQMGCQAVQESDGLRLTGGTLTAIETDMADMPDVVPTLAVVAAFAQGTTVINNVSHLKAKESDRLQAVVNELTKMGIESSCTDSRLFVTGGSPQAANIDTYDDHRMAMCFSLVGLKVPGIHIKDEACVNKSFPNYWEVLESLTI